MAEKNIEDVIRENSAGLMGLPGVIGVGEGVTGDKKCLVVFIADDEAEAAIPETIEGYPVVIEKSGTFQARGA